MKKELSNEYKYQKQIDIDLCRTTRIVWLDADSVAMLEKLNELGIVPRSKKTKVLEYLVKQYIND